ncbi:MAG: fimbria/pilus outer membrane usher protein [Burkholderiales bacterium]|nr:fimbria/pilus outer membrane usher protein [Burkholderiales bacterium]
MSCKKFLLLLLLVKSYANNVNKMTIPPQENSAKSICSDCIKFESEMLKMQIVHADFNGNQIDGSILTYIGNKTICLQKKAIASKLSKLAKYKELKVETERYWCITNVENDLRFNFNESQGQLHIMVKNDWLPFNKIPFTNNNVVLYPNDSFLADNNMYQLFYANSVVNFRQQQNMLGNLTNQFVTKIGSLVNQLSYSSQNVFTRNASFWQTDFPKSMTSLIIGDTTSYPGVWGNSIFYGGIHYGTNLNLQPNSNFSATPRIKGEVSVPSTMKLLINDKVDMGRVNIPSGPHEIYNLPGLTGAGDMKVNLIDSDTGLVYQGFTFPFYVSPYVLKEGTYQYRYDLGFPSVIDDGYNLTYLPSTLFFSTDHLYGINDYNTANLHLEASAEKFINLGITDNFILDNQFIASLTGASSVGIDHFGGLFGFGINHQATDSQQISYGYTYLMNSPNFQKIGQSSFVGSAYSTNQTVYINVPIMQSNSLLLGINKVTQLDDSDFIYYNAKWLWQITKKLNFNLSGTYASGAGLNNLLSIYANIIYIFGDGSTLQNSNSSNQSPTQTTQYTNMQYQFNDRSDIYGYNVGTDYQLNSQSNTGNPDLTVGGYYNGSNYNANTQIQFSNGGNYLIGGSLQGDAILSEQGLSFGRYSILSYAIVKIKNVPNVGVRLDGAFIGKTDSHGNFLIPELTAYFAHTISIDENSLPINITLKSYDQKIIAPLNGGVEVIFEPLKMIYGISKLLMPNGKPAPTGFDATLYSISDNGTKTLEDYTIISDNGFIQSSHYDNTKKYIVEFTDKSGSYSCTLQQANLTSNSQFNVYLKDSTCQKI